MLKDLINILSKLNFKRLWNIFLIRFSYYLTIIVKKNIHWGEPFSISIEPTTTCNLRCPECPSGLRRFSRNTGMLSLDMFTKVIDELGSFLMYIILYFQGEPYLNPSFFEFIKIAKKKRIYTATSTNGHFLNDENARKTIEAGLDRLIISLDGIGQEAYSEYRIGGSYKEVIEGINNIVKWKKKLRSKNPYVIVQFLVLKTNEHQIDDIKKLCDELSVDKLEFKTAQVYNYKNGNPLIPGLDRYSRYNQLPDGTWKFKNKLPNRCFRMWSSCVITWDGLIVPCCFDKDAEYRLGDIKDKSFKEIWRSKSYIDFRTKVFTQRKQIDICRNCTEGIRL